MPPEKLNSIVTFVSVGYDGVDDCAEVDVVETSSQKGQSMLRRARLPQSGTQVSPISMVPSAQVRTDVQYPFTNTVPAAHPIGKRLGGKVGHDDGGSIGGFVGGNVVGSEVVGEIDGDIVGSAVVGEVVGDTVGSALVGDLVGDVVGSEVVGDTVGSEVVGDLVGDVVGSEVDGDTVGDTVGDWVHPMQVNRQFSKKIGLPSQLPALLPLMQKSVGK